MFSWCLHLRQKVRPSQISSVWWNTIFVVWMFVKQSYVVNVLTKLATGSKLTATIIYSKTFKQLLRNCWTSWARLADKADKASLGLDFFKFANNIMNLQPSRPLLPYMIQHLQNNFCVIAMPIELKCISSILGTFKVTKNKWEAASKTAATTI